MWAICQEGDTEVPGHASVDLVTRQLRLPRWDPGPRAGRAAGTAVNLGLKQAKRSAQGPRLIRKGRAGRWSRVPSPGSFCLRAAVTWETDWKSPVSPSSRGRLPHTPGEVTCLGKRGSPGVRPQTWKDWIRVPQDCQGSFCSKSGCFSTSGMGDSSSAHPTPSPLIVFWLIPHSRGVTWSEATPGASPASQQPRAPGCSYTPALPTLPQSPVRTPMTLSSARSSLPFRPLCSVQTDQSPRNAARTSWRRRFSGDVGRWLWGPHTCPSQVRTAAGPPCRLSGHRRAPHVSPRALLPPVPVECLEQGTLCERPLSRGPSSSPEGY